MNAAPATASPAAAAPAVAARGEGPPAADRAAAATRDTFAALLGEAAPATSSPSSTPRATAAAAPPPARSSAAPCVTPPEVKADADADAAAAADGADPARAADDASAAAPAAAADAAAAPAAGPGDWLALLRQSLGLATGAALAAPAVATDEAVRGGAMPAAPASAATAAATATAAPKPAAAAVLPSGADLNPARPDGAPPPLFALAAPADDGGDAPDSDAPPAAVAAPDPAPFGGLATALPGALAGAPQLADASSTAAGPPPMTLPPDHPEFTDALGERIVWITDSGLGEARIELHPLDLGSLTVRVQIRGDEAQIAFTAAQPATRALLQNALPQLRELLSVQGLQLLRAQVDARVAPQRGGEAAFDAPHEAGATATRVRRVGRLELVDAYA